MHRTVQKTSIKTIKIQKVIKFFMQNILIILPTNEHFNPIIEKIIRLSINICQLPYLLLIMRITVSECGFLVQQERQ